ncbi:MAG: hypothetical protein AB1629_06385 [Candidatus Omnitrophota bacterium]
MKLTKAFSIIATVNIFALLIVYQRTEITKFSYKNKKSEDSLAQLMDRRDYLKFRIEYCKSLDRINDQLFAEVSNFQLPGEAQIVMLNKPQASQKKADLAKVSNKGTGLLSKTFFWLEPEAQAEPGE